MKIADLLIALIIAFFLSLFIAFGFRKKHPFGVFWLFFLIIFLTTLAAGFWIRPIGPIIIGFAWIPVFAATLLVAILIAASTPDESYNAIKEKGNGEMKTNLFFWILIVFLMLLIIAGFLI